MKKWDEANEGLFSSWPPDRVDEMAKRHSPAVDHFLQVFSDVFESAGGFAPLPAAGGHPTKILDVGCGSGHLLHRLLEERPWLAGAVELHGIDVSPSMIALADAGTRQLVARLTGGGAVESKTIQGSFHFHVGSLLDWNVDSVKPFSMITCLESVYYLSDMGSAFKWCHDALGPGGILLVMVEDGMMQSGDVRIDSARRAEISRHVNLETLHFLPKEAYMQLITDAGFDDVQATCEDDFHYFHAVK